MLTERLPVIVSPFSPSVFAGIPDRLFLLFNGFQMSRPDMCRKFEEVSASLRIGCQKSGEGSRTFERVAASACSHYVAVRPITAFYARLNVVNGQRCGFEDLPAVNAAMAVARKNLSSLHPASTP